MRVYLNVGNRRWEARLRRLHALGAVLECELPVNCGPAELRLEEEDLRLELPGEILRRSEQGIRRAYFELVDRFHPDRYHEKVPAPDRALLEELFRRLTAAYESLLS